MNNFGNYYGNFNPDNLPIPPIQAIPQQAIGQNLDSKEGIDRPVGEFGPVSEVNINSTVDNASVPIDEPKEPENQFNPNSSSLGLVQTASYDVERGTATMSATIDGMSYGSERTPDRIVVTRGVEDVQIPPEAPISNFDYDKDKVLANVPEEQQVVIENKEKISSEAKEEYMERINTLISAYTDYRSLLKTFGKDDIKEVLNDAKSNGMLQDSNDLSSIKDDDIYDNKGPGLLQ